MKKFIPLILLITISCSKSKAMQPSVLGTGTVLLFKASNGWGNNIFQAELNQYFSEHPDERYISATAVDGSNNTEPSEYIVIIQKIDISQKYVPPSLLPAIGSNGEIQYP